MNNLILLTSFIRGRENRQSIYSDEPPTISKEWVKCHLWFSGQEELDEFLKIYAHIPAPVVGKPKEIKWADFCTLTKKEMGIKDKE